MCVIIDIFFPGNKNLPGTWPTCSAETSGMESVKRIIATGGASSNRGILQAAAEPWDEGIAWLIYVNIVVNDWWFNMLLIYTFLYRYYYMIDEHRWWKMRSGDAVLNFRLCVLFLSSISWQDQIHQTRSCYDVWVQSDIIWLFEFFIRIGSPKLLPCGSCSGSFVVWAVFHHHYITRTYLHIIKYYYISNMPSNTIH